MTQSSSEFEAKFAEVQAGLETDLGEFISQTNSLNEQFISSISIFFQERLQTSAQMVQEQIQANQERAELEGEL